MQKLQSVVVGDGAVGKTSLLVTYLHKKFPVEYVPTVIDSYSTEVPIGNGNSIYLTLHDSAGQEEYDYLRPLSYPYTDIFLVCFSIDSVASYENVREKWVPEIKHYCPDIPFLLVGTKKDLRSKRSKAGGLIPPELGERLASQINALKYIECSAKTMDGLKKVFDVAISSALSAKTVVKTRSCTLQ